MFFEHASGEPPEDPPVAPDSPMRFAFAEYSAQLAAVPEQSEGVRMLPIGPGLVDTFDRTAIQLSAGALWQPGKSTANQIVVVVAGAGTSVIGGREFAWARGDMLAIPSWIAHQHRGERDSILVRVSDEPLMRTLSWLRSAAPQPN